MKKITAILTLLGFALVPALWADDPKPAEQTPPPCCKKAKDAKPGEKGTCPSGGAKQGCPAKDQAPTKA